VWRSRITFRHRSHDQNTKFLKIEDGDGRHFENGLSLYLGPESSDFDEIWCADSNFGSRTFTCWFIKNYEIQNGGQPSYWKSYFGYISTNSNFRINSSFQNGGRPPSSIFGKLLFSSRGVYPAWFYLYIPKYRVNPTITRGDIAKRQFSIWRLSVILNFII